MKYSLPTTLALLLLLGAGCAASSSESSTTAAETETEETATATTEDTTSASEELTITFTKNGYLPASSVIKKGTNVTFKNESGMDMWPASAMHPTHRMYPTTGGCLGSTFDACERVSDGESWSFTFDEVGVWKYHDHLSPTMFGMIMVEE